MKIALFGSTNTSNFNKHTATLMEALFSKASVFVEENYLKSLRFPKKESIPTFSQQKGLDRSFDMLISLGGDGTILQAATNYVKALGIPILGINLGRLGFLATVQKEEITDSVGLLLNQNYTIEERSLLQIHASNKSLFGQFNFALNEITVSRKDTTAMITIETYLNNQYLTSYWADGLIIATPTGSTGYSLSCGGPVIIPKSKNLVITPIAPHNLSARPLVISDDTEIRLKVFSRERKHLVSLDSRIFTLDSPTELTLSKAPFSIKMVQLPNQNFLKTLRNKMLWAQDKRN